MAAVALDIPTFRSMFEAFSDVTKWPDALITMYWGQTTSVMDNEDYGMPAATGLELYLLLAHLLFLYTNLVKGKQGGFVSSSTIDKVSVTKVAPPAADMFEWWLSQSGYGQQLLTMLLIDTVGGFSVGGLPERTGFRKVGGAFS